MTPRRLGVHSFVVRHQLASPPIKTHRSISVDSNYGKALGCQLSSLKVTECLEKHPLVVLDAAAWLAIEPPGAKVAKTRYSE